MTHNLSHKFIEKTDLIVNMSYAANTSSDNPITENPLDMAEDFGIGLAMVALVSILQHLAIAKFYTGGSLSLCIFLWPTMKI